MPYIPMEGRLNLRRDRSMRPKTPGELTFCIFRDAVEFLGTKPKYSDIATVLGSMEAAKLELYRRFVAPYEDKKIAENGDAL